MKIVVAMTGASGNMGRECLRQVLEIPEVEKVKILVRKNRKDRAFVAGAKRQYGKRVQPIYGDLANRASCDELVKDTQYVFHIGAVIPPHSDHDFAGTRAANLQGTCNMVDAVCALGDNQPKFVHVSTVALYGHRNYLHPWGRVGDPLLPSVYDVYAATKLKGERYVLDSPLKCWAVLRQTAMLHYNMMKDNMSDGLMFHTCVNVPLEWSTSKDSGLLVKRIVEKDLRGEVDSFWKKCYNIGGGEKNRVTGYDSYDKLLGTIGSRAEKVMKPGWHSIRNFHGLWFADGDVLNDMFDFQHDTYDDFCDAIVKKHPIYRAAALVPSKLISQIGFKRLLKHINSPLEWVKIRDKGRVRAFFGSPENLKCMTKSWKDFPVLAKGEVADGNIDYDAIRKTENLAKYGFLLNHGYDESKPDSELDIQDMRDAAAYRGGKCISETMTKGDLYTKLVWECHDGHRFEASPYTVLKAGHWCPVCCQPEPWDFDRLAKFMPFYAQVWYDTHAVEENTEYFFGGEKGETAMFRRY